MNYPTYGGIKCLYIFKFPVIPINILKSFDSLVITKEICLIDKTLLALLQLTLLLD